MKNNKLVMTMFILASHHCPCRSCGHRYVVKYNNQSKDSEPTIDEVIEMSVILQRLLRI